MTPPIRVWTVDELDAQPDQEWLIDELMPAGGIGTVFGATGTGKTFLALDLAMTMASGGGTWMGRSVRQGRVVYLAGEGNLGLKNRIRAWRNAHPSTNLEIVLVPDAIQLMSAEDVSHFIARVTDVIQGKCDLVVLDTWSNVTIGADENNRGETGIALAAVEIIRRHLGCTVLIVHHTGSNSAKAGSPRGSSAFLAAVDFAWLVERAKKGNRVKCAKMRDGAMFGPFGFSLKPVAPSCVVVGVVGPELTAHGEPLSRSATRALSVLAELEPTQGAVRATDWLKAVEGMPSSTFYVAMEQLLEMGAIRKAGSGYRPSQTMEGETPSPTPLSETLSWSESRTPAPLQTNSKQSGPCSPSLQHSFGSGGDGVPACPSEVGG